jgi:trimeric autotransporter adhesin
MNSNQDGVNRGCEAHARTARPWVLGLWAIAAGLAGALPAAAQPCQPRWSDEFVGVDVRSATVARILDDGSGPALYIGGDIRFPTPHGAHVVRRDHLGKWTFLGPGPLVGGTYQFGSRMVREILIFDDGTGAALFAITTNAAGNTGDGRLWKWTASPAGWQQMGQAHPGAANARSHVWSATVFDDGTGSALYIGGSFGQFDGVPASGLVRWRGQGSPWQAVGQLTHPYDVPSVGALHVLDDGGGVALYVGGRFSAIDGMTMNHIARFDGQMWSPLGAGASVGVTGWVENHNVVRAMASTSGRAGTALLVGGGLATAGGHPATGIAMWDGHAWHAMGNPGEVEALAMTTTASGVPRLFAVIKYVPSSMHLAWWDNPQIPNPAGQWSPTSAIQSGGFASIAVAEAGTPSERIWAAGSVSGISAGAGMPASFVPGYVAWNPGAAEWETERLGVFHNNNSHVNFLRALEFQGQKRLYASGAFSGIGELESIWTAAWDGQAWTSFGQGQRIYDAVVFDDGSGAAIYIARLCSQPCNSVRRWDGSTWEDVGSAALRTSHIAVLAEPSGPTLYAATMNFAGLAGLVRWDGSVWTAVGPPLVFGPGTPQLNSLVMYDDGSGPALYLAGSFTHAGGIEVNGLARFRDGMWSAVGGGLAGGRITTLALLDDGAGSALYAGGSFLSAGGAPAARIARWDGVSWSALGSGIQGHSLTEVVALAAFDDGRGMAIYAGGFFMVNGAQMGSNLARFDGVAWTPAPADATVMSMEVFDDGRGPALWLGGKFSTVEDVVSVRLARRVACQEPPCYANCDQSSVTPILNVEDFTCFINRYVEGLALPHQQQLTHYANCDGSTEPPVLNAEDFTCFLDAFAAGCR